jgi:predicted unusual protein kinase regulating ubiquinone biosynthesis (AarF/ABC1/UbiB family)
MMRQLNWTANIFQTFSRLMIYGFGGLRWASAILWDKLLRRDTIERRAVRLREAIERIGGSAVKVGQQMAMRIDLLPYEYTVELTKMLDRMPTFPTSYAIERIETVMGKPLLEVFTAFDPVPIGLRFAGRASGRNLSPIAMHSPPCLSSSNSSPSFVPDCRGISYTNSAAC